MEFKSRNHERIKAETLYIVVQISVKVILIVYRERNEWVDGWTFWILSGNSAHGRGWKESHENQSKVIK